MSEQQQVRHPGNEPWSEDELAAHRAHWKTVAQMDAGEGYDWAVFGVWQRVSDGRVFYDEDSGRSCSAPFDSYDLSWQPSHATTYREVREAADRWLKENEFWGDGRASASQIADFRAAVRKVLP